MDVPPLANPQCESCPPTRFQKRLRTKVRQNLTKSCACLHLDGLIQPEKHPEYEEYETTRRRFPVSLPQIRHLTLSGQAFAPCRLAQKGPHHLEAHLRQRRPPPRSPLARHQGHDRHLQAAGRGPRRSSQV